MPIMTKTPGGEDIVILSRHEFDQLMCLANEDANDIKIANRIMARVAAGTEELLTSSEATDLLAAKSPLAFWRKKRGKTQGALSAETKLAQGFISEIEAGKKTGDVKSLRKIAAALNVTIDDLTG